MWYNRADEGVFEMKRILVIEDHRDISAMLVESLLGAGYQAQSAQNGADGLRALREHKEKFDLVLLDIMLPHLNGDELLRELRGFSTVPVIVISAKDGIHTKVELLKLGADDYITKPFDLMEVLARVESALRRAGLSNQETNTLRYKDLSLDTEARQASIGETELSLTAREYAILELLMRHQHKVFTKANLFESIWGEDFVGDDSAVKAHISNLRSKLKAITPNTEYIETVWGIGYRMQTN